MHPQAWSLTALLGRYTLTVQDEFGGCTFCELLTIFVGHMSVLAFLANRKIAPLV